MILFFDTSALVKFFHEEEGSENVSGWIYDSANEIWLLDLAKLEFTSAIFRRFRNKEISDESLQIALKAFEEQIAMFHIEPLGQAVVHEAESLLKHFGKTSGLRTLDALHLGAYLLLAEKNWAFVAADHILCKTATLAGCTVLNPVDEH